MTIRFKFADLKSEDVVAVINSQCDRLAMAYDENKGLAIKTSRTQLAQNMKIAGVSRIESVPNRNCFTCTEGGSFTRADEFVGSKN